MAELTFDEALEMFMEKIRGAEQDEDYYDAVDVIVYLWDQERVDQLNKAVLPTPMYKEAQPGELYMLLKITPLRYLQVKRNKNAQVIQYG